MFCEKCKSELKPGELYCNNCGARVPELNNSSLNNQIPSQPYDSTANNINSQATQQVSNSQMNSNLNNNYNTPIKKSNKNGGKIIMIIVALLLIIGTAGYYFISMNNPKNVYKNLVKNLINEIYDVSYLEDDKINSTFNLGLNVKLEDESIDQSILDLINKTKLSMNFQMDRNLEQLVAKIDTDYDNESLIDLQFFVDNKNKKSYLYAKDYYDKYIEIGMDDDNTLNELFEPGKLNLTQKVNQKKSKKILIKELTSIIKDEDCYKENGMYIFKISSKELADRLKTALTNLKNNQEFVDCYQNPDEVKENLENIISSITVENPNQTIKYSVSKKVLTNKIEKLIVSSEKNEISFEMEDNKINYILKEDNESILSGYIVITKEKNGKKYEVSIKIPNVGELTLNFDILNEKTEEIDKVDTTKTTTINEITKDEQMKIVEKLQTSKIYEIITSLSGMSSDNNYDFNTDSDLDDNSTLSSQLDVYGYKTINLTVPSGFTSIYESDNYKTYSNGDIEVTFRANSYDDADEYLKTLDSKVTTAKKDEYYKNINLSDKKSKMVNNVVYYYKDYTFDYVSKISNIKYYEKYLCTDLGSNYYLIVEVSSKNSEIADNLLNTILSIN